MLRAEPAALRGAAQSGQADVVAGEGGERDESGRTSDGRHDESIEIVQHRSGDQLGECPGIAGVRRAQRPQVSRPLPLLDDRWRVSQPSELKVEQQPSDPAVAIEKRMNPFDSRACP
jgi:hypothetical protein